MRRRLIRCLVRPLPCPTIDADARAVMLSDASALAALMLDAYRGSIDDAGEGPDEAAAEVQKLLSGGYGAFDSYASELIERNGQLVAATLVTHFEGKPLLAFSITASEWKRQGLARQGLIRVMHRLRESGAAELRLVVTAGNIQAERLYESLGFVEG